MPFSGIVRLVNPLDPHADVLTGESVGLDTPVVIVVSIVESDSSDEEDEVNIWTVDCVVPFFGDSARKP